MKFYCRIKKRKCMYNIFYIIFISNIVWLFYYKIFFQADLSLWSFSSDRFSFGRFFFFFKLLKLFLKIKYYTFIEFFILLLKKRCTNKCWSNDIHCIRIRNTLIIRKKITKHLANVNKVFFYKL